MSEHYIIDSTDGTVKIGLPPGAYNGPSGPVVSSDLRLYGAGHRQWGEGVDENFYRMLENWACPAKHNGDYNPATGLNDFNAATDPITPRDAHDLGGNTGINNPVKGQLWFNTTAGELYVYTDPLWKAIGSVFLNPPVDPGLGNLWYDQSVPQLKVWTGSAWVSVADRYVLKAGDTMTGDLIMSGAASIHLNEASNARGIVMDTAAQKGISWNDGVDDFAIRAGHGIVSGAETRLVSGDGVAKLTMTTDGAAGAVTMKVGAVGVAGVATFGNTLQLTTSGLTANCPATLSGGTLTFSNATSNTLLWNSAGVAAPTVSSRSAGTKLVLYPGLSAAEVDYAIGIAGGTMWNSVPNSSSFFRWYAGTANIATLSGAGVLTTDKIITNANGASDNVLLGNDAYIGDVNVANYFGIRGAATATVAGIRFGFGGTPGDLYYNGASFEIKRSTAVTGTLSATSTISTSGLFSGASLSVTGSIGGASLGVTGAITGASLSVGPIVGTSLNVSSSTHTNIVTNLDADLLDGHHWSEIPSLFPAACKGVQTLQWTGSVVANNNPQDTWKNITGAAHVINVPSGASYVYVLWTGNAEFFDHQYSVIWRLTLNGNQIGIEDDTQGATVAPNGLSFGQKITISAAFPISPGSYTIQLQSYSYSNDGTVTTNKRHTTSGHPNGGGHTLTVMYF